ncbi:MAG: hypothetical protein Q8N98_00935, partial [bacterium]|nr:hypothetical protein [bacterium]
MLQETKRQTAGVAQASWHDFLPEPCRREPFQSFGLFVFYGSPLFPPPLTNLLVRGLYYQATHIPEPLGLDDRQARAA